MALEDGCQLTMKTALQQVPWLQLWDAAPKALKTVGYAADSVLLRGKRTTNRASGPGLH